MSAGRPKAKIDWDYVDELLEKQCTGTEIAARLGIHYNTLYERCKKENNCEFSEYSQQKKQSGKTLLREAQFDKAIDGNTTMLVWLGKQYLEQKDRVETEDKSLSHFEKWISQYEVEPETNSSPTSPEESD